MNTAGHQILLAPLTRGVPHPRGRDAGQVEDEKTLTTSRQGRSQFPPPSTRSTELRGRFAGQVFWLPGLLLHLPIPPTAGQWGLQEKILGVQRGGPPPPSPPPP